MAASPATPKVFRLPLTARLLSLFTALFLGAVGAVMFGFVAVCLGVHQWLVAIAVAVSTAILVGLTHYVWRDLSGKWSLRVTLSDDSVDLLLPRNRSLIHKTPHQHVTIAYPDIAAIETRLEAYPSFGMVNMQRPYVLGCRNGDQVYLFEERAVGTGLNISYFGEVVAEIAARAHFAIHDLGMSEGGGGVLGVWGTRAADLAAPALPFARQNRLWRKAGNTGALAFLVLNLAFILGALFRYLESK